VFERPEQSSASVGLGLGVEMSCEVAVSLARKEVVGDAEELDL
jgi:hypothetical protein